MQTGARREPCLDDIVSPKHEISAGCRDRRAAREITVSRIVSITPPRQRQPVKQTTAERNYMAWIATLPCVTCGAEPVEVAHIRMPALEHGKRQCGKGEKPAAWWTVPLCPTCHRLGPDAQHAMSERRWWASWCIDPIQVCLQLQAIYGADGIDREREARAYLGKVRR